MLELMESHPTWVRGLKFPLAMFSQVLSVAPHVGAWIEMLIEIGVMPYIAVAPHVGAWIEMR